MAEVNFTVIQYKNDVTSIKRVGHLKGSQHLKTVNREGWTRRVVNEEIPFMSTKEYKTNLANYAERIADVDLQKGKFKKITLTSKEFIDYDNFAYEVKKFVINLKNNYGKYEYILAIECNKDFNHFHCHIVVIFSDLAPVLNRSWLKEHWVHGNVNIRNSRDGEESDDLGYLTKFKENTIQENNPEYTKYPQFAKFIRTSRNLPRVEKLSTKIVDKDTAIKLLNSSNKLGRVNRKTHMYNNKVCLDSAYIYNVNTKQFLDKTLEDENILFEDIVIYVDNVSQNKTDLELKEDYSTFNNKLTQQDNIFENEENIF